PATALAGPGMLLAVLVAAVPMFVIAVTYAFMGSALPTSGASFEWSRRFIHPFVGFLIAWLRIVSNVGAILVLALVAVRYLSMVVPLPTKPTMLAAFVLFFLANYFGVSLAARLQVILMAALVVLFFIFAAWGAPYIEPTHFEPLLPQGTAGMLAAVPLLIGLFFGIEAATEIGDEVKDGRKTIPLGIGLSILSAVALYLMVGVVALGVLGPEALARSETPLLDAAQPFMGPIAKPLIVTAAVVAIGKSLNSLYLGFSRNLFAMARAGMLPAALARVHPKYGTPHVALWTILGGATLGLLAPMNLTSLFLAVNIPTLLKYAATSFSAAVVVRKHPEIYAAARFKLSPRATVGWAYAGAAAALVIAVLGFQADWMPYAALGVWAMIGITYYVFTHRQTA
ncbi:MAG: amino acid permease-associated protein, partial [Phenylobacterium sp.]|nr:amino acid permease-associated protein [Phenylobacterium sp.]